VQLPEHQCRNFARAPILWMRLNIPTATRLCSMQVSAACRRRPGITLNRASQRPRIVLLAQYGVTAPVTIPFSLRRSYAAPELSIRLLSRMRGALNGTLRYLGLSRLPSLSARRAPYHLLEFAPTNANGQVAFRCSSRQIVLFHDRCEFRGGILRDPRWRPHGAWPFQSRRRPAITCSISSQPDLL